MSPISRSAPIIDPARALTPPSSSPRATTSAAASLGKGDLLTTIKRLQAESRDLRAGQQESSREARQKRLRALVEKRNLDAKVARQGRQIAALKLEKSRQKRELQLRDALAREEARKERCRERSRRNLQAVIHRNFLARGEEIERLKGERRFWRQMAAWLIMEAAVRKRPGRDILRLRRRLREGGFVHGADL